MADPTSSPIRLAVVVPCYNEQLRLCPESFAAGLDLRLDWAWILVDDGSSDGTEAVLRSLAGGRPHVHVLKLGQNLGKAGAVREGTLWAIGQVDPAWVAYLDADLATPVQELARMYDEHCSVDSGLVAVLGSRMQRLGTRIERTRARHYLGRIAATAISLILRMPTYDTQCGAKLWRADVAADLFSEPFCSRWLFDVELLARCRNRMGRRQFEAAAVEEPLRRWLERGGSKIRLRDLIRIPRELLELHWRYNQRK